jgi:CheY-like chemotaxis protein
MPDMDGFEVAAYLAARPQLAATTILMLSSSGEYVDQARCTELGIAAYLTKPVYAVDLLGAIERALGPRAPEVTPAAAKSRPGAFALGPAGDRARILLVEDNVVNQRVAAGLLTRRGHHVTVARNGQEALDLLLAGTFDLVLMDLQMPVMGGLDATAAIRERERGTGARTRIIAMTAHAMDSDRDRCLAAGMDDYLSKPIDPAKLFAMVEGRGNGASASPPVAEELAFDADALQERLSGDAELVTDVIRLFLQDLPVQLAAIDRAVSGHEHRALELAAHALKGAAGALSAGALASAADALEEAASAGDSARIQAACTRTEVEAGRLVDLIRPPGAPAGPYSRAS